MGLGRLRVMCVIHLRMGGTHEIIAESDYFTLARAIDLLKKGFRMADSSGLSPCLLITEKGFSMYCPLSIQGGSSIDMVLARKGLRWLL